MRLPSGVHRPRAPGPEIVLAALSEPAITKVLTIPEMAAYSRLAGSNTL